MEYKVIYAQLKKDLESQVNEAMREGFEPIGGISVFSYEVDNDGYSEIEWHYLQAMLKRGE